LKSYVRWPMTVPAFQRYTGNDAFLVVTSLMEIRKNPKSQECYRSKPGFGWPKSATASTNQLYN